MPPPKTGRCDHDDVIWTRATRMDITTARTSVADWGATLGLGLAGVSRSRGEHSAASPSGECSQGQRGMNGLTPDTLHPENGYACEQNGFGFKCSGNVSPRPFACRRGVRSSQRPQEVVSMTSGSREHLAKARLFHQQGITNAVQEPKENKTLRKKLASKREGNKNVA